MSKQQAKLSIGKTSTQSTLSFGNPGSTSKLSIKKADPVPVLLSSIAPPPSKKQLLEDPETKKIEMIPAESMKMIVDEQQEDECKGITRSKKRAIVDEEEEEQVAIVEEDQVEIKAPVKTTPGKASTAKKTKLDDGKAAESVSKASIQKIEKEEIKDNVTMNGPAPVVTGPPKDLEKLKAPSSPAYDPIQDAPFYKGQPVPFSFLTRALSEIEQCKGQKSKDAIKEIIANVFRSAILLAPAELPDLFYFFCIKLAPDYEGLETGIGHEILLKSVAKACGKSPKQIREQFQKEGDLGLVVQLGKSTQNTLGSFFTKKVSAEPKAGLTFRQVFEAFKKISKSSGNNSQLEKENIIVKILHDSTNEESKFIVRWLEKNLKTGAAEKTFISALARAFGYSPPNKKSINMKKQLGEAQFAEKCQQIEFDINEAICEFPNYGEIINNLLEVGDETSRLKERCHIRVGIPVKPMLAKPTKGVREVLDRFEQLSFTCEYKYDGFRGQIHFNRKTNTVEIYSRNLESMTIQYPDVVDFIKQSVKDKPVEDFILDSELVAYDTVQDRILPFQILTQRSRKNVTEEDLKTKICICAFDLLYLNGKSLLKENFATRREHLQKNFTEVNHSFVFAKYKNAESFEEIQEFLNESIKDSCEGLMVKTLEVNATYEPSKRSLNWLKLKKDYLDQGAFADSIDLVVVGADWGKGKRAGMFGSFLLACYDENNEQLQTVTKMGGGIGDELMAKIFNELKDMVIDKAPSNLRFKEKNVDVWLMPKYVWEVRCADLSMSPIYCASIGSIEPGKGIALRFPRFIRERDDKRIEDATSSDQILEYFKSQPAYLAKEGGDDDEYDF